MTLPGHLRFPVLYLHNGDGMEMKLKDEISEAVEYANKYADEMRVNYMSAIEEMRELLDEQLEGLVVSKENQISAVNDISRICDEAIKSSLNAINTSNGE